MVKNQIRVGTSKQKAVHSSVVFTDEYALHTQQTRDVDPMLG